jgi:hypothetical protein
MDPAVFGESSEVVAGPVIDNARVTTSRVHFSVPVGVGVEYPLSERFSVNIETSYRFVFTDYLDISATLLIQKCKRIIFTVHQQE